MVTTHSITNRRERGTLKYTDGWMEECEAAQSSDITSGPIIRRYRKGSKCKQTRGETRPR